MKSDMEILFRDGAARIARFRTPHGHVETPAIMPVINPSKMLLTPSEMKKEFGTQIVITNSYIIRRNDELREKAAREGVHGLLSFDGPIMTDSGTFQTHEYPVAIDPDEIFRFQLTIGSDIVTVLDVFTEPDCGRDKARSAVKETVRRTQKAVLENSTEQLVSGTIQGSLFADIREEAGHMLSSAGIDYCSIGGVVPLMEQQRFSELIAVIGASTRKINRALPLHLFGAGHPSIMPLAVLLGCDLFDSASYVKYARDGRLMFPWGTVHVTEISHSFCTCPACIDGLSDVRISSWNGENEDIVKLIARHNLYVLQSELARIKHSIRSGTLWNLVQERVRSNPRLLEAFSAALSQKNIGDYEPLSRRHGFNVFDSLSLKIPGLTMSIRRASEIRPGNRDQLLLLTDGNQYFSRFDFSIAEDKDVACITPLGIIPLYLTETYPFAQSSCAVSLPLSDLQEYVLIHGYRHFSITSWKERPANVFPPRAEYVMQALSVLHFQFQNAVNGIDALPLDVKFSVNTGKLRELCLDGREAFHFRPEDGLFSLRMTGAAFLHSRNVFPLLRVECSDDAVPFVLSHKSLFSKFVTRVDRTIRPGDECIVVDREDRLLACGRALLAGSEMPVLRRGVAVEIRESLSDLPPFQQSASKQ
ncbi:MAG: tRNA guanosine(15) transglycosylase TgtA [Methanomassiliicoccales archaeon]